MLYLYSGTPGSGKSLHCANLILSWIKLYKSNVISVNLKLNKEEVYKDTLKYKFRFLDFLHYKDHKKKYYFSLPKSKRGTIYNIMDINSISPEFFYKYAATHHKKGKEHQSLIIIDEAQMVFAPEIVKVKNQEYRERTQRGDLKHSYTDGYRKAWLEFFTHHRHLGYDILLISQFDKLIDAQIRCCFEYNVSHKKVNNYSIGFILSLFGISLFMSKTFWYGTKLSCGLKFFTYHKRYSKVYDSYKLFDEILLKYNKNKVEKNISTAEL